MTVSVEDYNITISIHAPREGGDMQSWNKHKMI